MAKPRILVDADACPVKDEIYDVAYRRGVAVTIVANSWFRVPQHPLVTRVVVDGGFDAADDWIAEQADAALRGDHRRHPAGRPLPQGRGERARRRPGAPSPPPRSARRWPPARSWPICAPGRGATASAAPHRSPRPIARASSRRSTKRWCGWSARGDGHRHPARDCRGVRRAGRVGAGPPMERRGAMPPSRIPRGRLRWLSPSARSVPRR